MTITATAFAPNAETPASARPKNFYTEETTIRSWALTLDHKRIGVLFLVGTALSLLLGGVFAMLLRIEHLTPGPTIVSASTYNRLFTLHGVVMVWMFMIPAIPSGFGNVLLPLMIGARDVAFPRLNLASWYLYVLGCVVVVTSVVAGGIDTGWTFYMPYSVQSPSHVVPAVLGVFILGLSTIASGINFIVTTHTLRAEGIGWMRVPFFVWTIYATSIIQVLATPVLGMVLLLVALDRLFGLGTFDPALGGDPVLFQHLFWFYSHPAVYIMVLPAMGVISEVVCTFSQNPVPSYRLIVISSIGIAFVGFLTWGHHMFTAGISTFDAGAFGVLSMLVAIFSAIKVFAWVGALRGGSITFTTPPRLRLLFLVPVRLRRHDGRRGSDREPRRALARHVLRGRSLSLHHGRSRHDRLPRRASLLVSVAHRTALLGACRVGRGGSRIRGLLLHVLPPIPSRKRRHAAAVLRVSGALPDAARDLHGRFVGARERSSSYARVSRRCALRGEARGDNPWHSLSFEWRVPNPPPTHNFGATPPSFDVGAYDYAIARAEQEHV